MKSVSISVTAQIKPTQSLLWHSRSDRAFTALNGDSMKMMLRIFAAFLLFTLPCYGQLAKKGKLLFADDFKTPATYTKDFQPVAPGWRVRVWHSEWRHTSKGVESVWTSGHMPVLGYQSDEPFQNVIIEAQFRFVKQPGKKADFRISATNPVLDPRAYSVSAWANSSSNERPLGLVLEHDQWKPGTITTVQVVPASFKPNRWYTMRLEVIGNEALATVNGVQASGSNPKFGLPKTVIALGTGFSPHELRRLRVWEALPVKPSANVANETK